MNKRKPNEYSEEYIDGLWKAYDKAKSQWERERKKQPAAGNVGISQEAKKFEAYKRMEKRYDKLREVGAWKGAIWIKTKAKYRKA